MTKPFPARSQRRQSAFNAPSKERQRRDRRGRQAEFAAVLFLTLKGYRIVDRRARLKVGEIDIVAVRRSRLAFVEVKLRRTVDDGLSAMTPRQRRRLRMAASLWMKRNPDYRELEPVHDLIAIAPWRWPVHVHNIRSDDVLPDKFRF